MIRREPLSAASEGPHSPNDSFTFFHSDIEKRRSSHFSVPLRDEDDFSLSSHDHLDIIENPVFQGDTLFDQEFESASESLSQQRSQPIEVSPKIRPPLKKPSLLPPLAGQFSFSEANDSVREFQASPIKAAFSDGAFENNTEFVNPETDLVPLLPLLHGEVDTIQSSLPQKSIPMSVNSNAIGLIIGNYDYSTSLLAVDKDKETAPIPLAARSGLVPDRVSLPQEPTAQRIIDHNRNNSGSSTISSASTSSTLTTSKNNNQQRFLRYAMNTQAISSLQPNRWPMAKVLTWLDLHGFNESWKETFRRNEISGNRFLELSNYEASSIVWQQISKRLDLDSQNNAVERFILLLKSDLLESEYQTAPTSASSGPGESAGYLAVNKAEFRKSSSTLWAQSLPPTTSKPRPFSYIDPSTTKAAKESPHSHKFFRKHHRTSSTESTKDSPSSGSSFTTTGTQGQRNSIEQLGTPSSAGSRKSGIFSTLRKYGTDKAAGIVKQVSTPSAPKPQASSRRSTSGFSHKKTNLSSKSVSSFRHEAAVRRSTDELHSPKLARSFTYLPSDENIPSPIESTRLSHRSMDGGDLKKELIDSRYLPKPKSLTIEASKVVLLTRDNISFTPVKVLLEELGNISQVKRKFIRSLELIEIGNISFHLTDFNAVPGESMSDDILLSVLQLDFFLKIRVLQTINSPIGTTTFSSTSSDSKSFETSGDNGKVYPATPQYLLQESKDKGVDYLNFKDKELINQIRNARKLDGQPVQKLELQIPITLSLPPNKRLPQENKRSLPPLNTSQFLSPHVSAISPAITVSPSSFSVLRKEGKEIDFDKRRQSSSESRAPRLIPNIYSSSVTNSSVSPISASTIHTLRDDQIPSPSTRTMNPSLLVAQVASRTSSQSEKSPNIIAKRKAPPPPSKANSLKVANKPSFASFTSLVTTGSLSGLRGDDASLSSGSELSYRSSMSRGSKIGYKPSAFKENKIVFDDAPQFTQGLTKGDFDDEDSFFVKPIKSTLSREVDQDDDDEDFFMKPHRKTLVGSTELNQMSVRPPVEEVYKNLEKYFPNTNLDKPIIDASLESPSAQPNPQRLLPAPRKISISRTFSNANISPNIPPVAADDEVLYGDGPKLRRRMKTIRIVANEARIKRLASQKAVSDSTSVISSKRDKVITPILALNRTNTKLWGQKVVEVTSAAIEKGFVSRIRNTVNGQFEEFAWIKGELIGRGSFGSVYLALNVTTGDMLAVKQVIGPLDAAQNSEGLDALHKEVETMKDLDHLNIVQYLGFEQKRNTFSLFLEYVAGGSIQSCLKAYGKFDEPLVKFITCQVLEGLRYLHSNGILHRDLKADNLLLEIDGTCKISDFGISKKSQDIYSNNAEMSMQGTVFWMAPEVIHSIVENKKQGYSAKVDIWSLGCVVLEMFAGQRPWSNEAVISAIYKIGKTKLAPPIPDDVSPEAKDFLNLCFTIDSEKRPTAEKLLQHPFMKIDSTFSFSQTRLREIINSRRFTVPE